MRSPQHQCHCGIHHFADVWLNDELLGHHEGYFAPFGFDVTDRLRKNNLYPQAVVGESPEDLDPDQFFFAHKKRIIKGTLKYHDSRPPWAPHLVKRGAPTRR